MNLSPALAENAMLILDGVSRIQKQQGFGVIVVEHRLKLIAPHVDRVSIMVRARLRDTRDTSILADQVRLERHYLL